MVRVYLCRHGETEENAAGILQGQMPGHLSSLGREQAKELGEHLAGIEAHTVVCSDLQRTIDTARIALGCEPQLEPLLRERDWGRHTGRPIRQALVDGLNEADSGESAPESVEAMLGRAAVLVEKWRRECDGQTIIAVGHGLFNRAVIAAASGCTLREVPRYGNAEVREIVIDKPARVVIDEEEIKATAN